MITADSRDLFAALDLGSNSFHLLLARRTAHGFHTIDRMKEKVQLLAGFADGKLHPVAVARGEASLARFAQRLAALPRENVRMVGTHALRETKDARAFLERARQIVGVPLEVIPGKEEARLVFLGVARHVGAAAADGHGAARLVIDVGGGSTEFAWSAGHPSEPGRLASFKVGCVSLRDWYFAAGEPQDRAFEAARARAEQAFRRLERPGGREVIGTSGTVESVQSVLAANGWGGELITRDGLASLTDAVISGRWLVEAGLPGLAPERVDIFPAGLAIVDAVFRALELTEMRFVDASLQDGLLYDQLGERDPDEDLQARSVEGLQRRFHVDKAQAARVRRSVLGLFDATDRGWWRHPERWRDLLGWAAELHELGKAVSARHYHRHGAYLLQNSDLRAFSQARQRQLALLLRGHRRAFPGMAVRTWEAEERQDLIRVLALLRCAVIIHRGHCDADDAPVAVAAGGDALTLTFPAGWLAAHPLSAREFEVETAQLADAGLRLTVREDPGH